MSAKTALTMAHPAVSANGQPNHALAAVPSANTALTIDSVLMMSHGIIGDMGFRPLGLAGTLAHFLFFGFRLISLMSPVTALMRAAMLAARSEMLQITLILFWRESRVTFSVADESPQPVAARLCSVRLRFRCFFPRFRNSIPQTTAYDVFPNSNF